MQSIKTNCRNKYNNLGTSHGTWPTKKFIRTHDEKKMCRFNSGGNMNCKIMIHSDTFHALPCHSVDVSFGSGFRLPIEYSLPSWNLTSPRCLTVELVSISLPFFLLTHVIFFRCFWGFWRWRCCSVFSLLGRVHRIIGCLSLVMSCLWIWWN